MPSKNYAVIDVETTGLSPTKNKVIEVAIILFDGKKVIKEFHSLVNPETPVPPFILNLTGINLYELEGAPRFCEIAKEIVELTEDTIFVAHNASFDYGFIRAEYSRLGYEFKKQTICTVRESRKHIPGLKSYSLKNLVKELKIDNSNPHRALSDARATVEILKRIKAAKTSSPIKRNLSM